MPLSMKTQRSSSLLISTLWQEVSTSVLLTASRCRFYHTSSLVPETPLGLSDETPMVPDQEPLTTETTETTEMVSEVFFVWHYGTLTLSWRAYIINAVYFTLFPFLQSFLRTSLRTSLRIRNLKNLKNLKNPVFPIFQTRLKIAEESWRLLKLAEISPEYPRISPEIDWNFWNNWKFPVFPVITVPSLTYGSAYGNPPYVPPYLAEKIRFSPGTTETTEIVLVVLFVLEKLEKSSFSNFSKCGKSYGMLRVSYT